MATTFETKMRALNYLIDLATHSGHQGFPIGTALGPLNHDQLINVLKHGSDAKKEQLLAGEPFNISFQELAAIQAELEQVFYQSTLKFWWW
jgi:hypothetical protein